MLSHDPPDRASACVVIHNVAGIGHVASSALMVSTNVIAAEDPPLFFSNEDFVTRCEPKCQDVTAAGFAREGKRLTLSHYLEKDLFNRGAVGLTSGTDLHEEA